MRAHVASSAHRSRSPREGQGGRIHDSQHEGSSGTPPRCRGPAHAATRVRAAIAAAVVDPEIPVLTLEDLGVLRGVERRKGRIVVKLTPTYTGCPATLAIQLAVEAALAEAGLPMRAVETVLSPPWSTDDITEEGRRKLKEFGIAPPARRRAARALFAERDRGLPQVRLDRAPPRSPSSAPPPARRCGAARACAEPFDYFKCL